MTKNRIFTGYVIFSIVSNLIYSQSSEPYNKSHLDSLLKNSRELSEKRDFEGALKVQGMADEYTLKYFGNESVEFGNCLYNKGRIFYLQANFKEAKNLFLKSEMIRKIKLGEDHPDYAQSLNSLAAVNVEFKNYNEAEELYVKVNKLREKILGKEHPDYAQSLNNLGVMYWKMSEYKKAEPLYLEALQIYGKAYNKEHKLYTTCLHNLATLYNSMGLYKKAEVYHLEALQIKEKISGKADRDYANGLNSLGKLYANTGQYEKAELLYNEALGILKKTVGETHKEYLNCIHNLSSIFIHLGNYKKAEELRYKVLVAYEKKEGKESIEYASNLNSFGVLLVRSGNFKKAEEFYLESIRIYEKFNLNNQATFATYIHNLATLYFDQGKYHLSDSLHHIALMAREKSYGKEHPKYAQTLNNLGVLNLRIGNYTKAREYLYESLNIRRRLLGMEHKDYSTSLDNLSMFYLVVQNFDSAVFYLKQLDRLNKTNLDKSLRHLSENELYEYYQSFSDRVDRLFSVYQKVGSKYPDLAEVCFDNCLYFKNFLLHNANQIRILSQSNPEAAENFAVLKSFHNKLSQEYSKPIRARDSSLVERLVLNINKIEKQLARTVGGYDQTTQKLTWRDVKNKLKPGEATIELMRYHYTNPEKSDSVMYAAFLLRADSERPEFIPLFEERQLATLITRYTEDSSNIFYNNLYSNSSASGLYKLIWNPLREKLADIKTVYLSPAGQLNRINLGAIPQNDKTCMAELFEIVIMNGSKSIITRKMKNDSNIYFNSEHYSKSGIDAILYGGVEFDMDSTTLNKVNSDHDNITIAGRSAAGEIVSDIKFEMTDTAIRGGNWYYLKWTEKEIESIESILKMNQAITKSYKSFAASEESFKSIGVNEPSPKIVHVATHGYFFEDPKLISLNGIEKEQEEPVFKMSEHPMIRSGLILSGGNHAWKTGKPFKEGMEDGILTAYEISQMNLSNTELVVLSACETGLGDIQGNEGVYGLQRAFKIAGAKYLIMSLWQVPDKQTSILMTTFYKKWLNEKMTIPEAFRATQKEMRKAGFDPYHWAGFILVE